MFIELFRIIFSIRYSKPLSFCNCNEKINFIIYNYIVLIYLQSLDLAYLTKASHYYSPYV